jgi:hypothetical protein
VQENDVIKLGDVSITLLPEDEPGTVVMEDMSGAGEAPDADPESTVPEVPESALPRATARPPASPPAPLDPPPTPRLPIPRPPRIEAAATAAPAGAPAHAAEALPVPVDAHPRPLTVTVLAVLWMVSVFVYAIGGAVLAWQAHGIGRAAFAVGGLTLALVAAAMAVGLWLRQPWAYVGQLVIAGVGLFFCPFSLASIAVLVYMLRPAARWHFSARRDRAPEGVGQAEAMFTGALVAAVVLGVVLTAALTFLARTARTGPRALLGRAPAAEAAAVARMREVVAAQEAFHSVCNTGYGDLQALLRPATVIRDYPAAGPAFLRDPALEEPERDGYRYALTVGDEMPPAEGCPVPRYRRYLYAAAPLGEGAWLAVGPDGVVRQAEGRPATPDDPAVP